MNLRENKLKVYKSAFVTAVVSSELFKQKGSTILAYPNLMCSPACTIGTDSSAPVIASDYCSLVIYPCCIT